MNVLYIGDLSLKEPNRGTPLRVFNFLKQIQKEHKLFVCASKVGEEFADQFILFPKVAGIKKVFFLRKVVRSKQIDFIFSATEIGMRVPIALKFLCGVKTGIDLHSIMADERYLSGNTNKIGRYFLDRRTKFYLRFYNVIFTVSDSLKKYYRRERSKITVVYGGIDLAELKKLPPVQTPQTFTIGYTGNTRTYQGIDSLFDAVKILKGRGISTRINLIISSGDKLCKEKIHSRDLTAQTTLNSNVPHLEAEQLIRQSSVLVIPRPSIPVTEYAFPSKWPEYLATGIPVIITTVGPVRELKNELQDISVLISPSHIVEELADALLRVMHMNQSDRDAMGRRASAYAREHFSWDFLGETIRAALRKYEMPFR